jgi:hypothetical protein
MASKSRLFDMPGRSLMSVVRVGADVAVRSSRRRERPTSEFQGSNELCKVGLYLRKYFA